MSSPRRHPQTSLGLHVFRAACAVLLAGSLLTGCSKQEPVATEEEDWLLDSADTLRAEVKAGGIDTSYVAHFDGTQIKRISEVRKAGAGNAAKGEYEFNGARLMRYQGAALLGAQDIELTFDMQGALVSSGGADDAEVSAIRNRASLLRSLALTKRTTQSHGG